MHPARRERWQRRQAIHHAMGAPDTALGRLRERTDEQILAMSPTWRHIYATVGMYLLAQEEQHDER